MTITEFLLARIAEDEKRIRYYGGLKYGTTREWAECAAKRAIVELHRPTTETVEWFDAPDSSGKALVCSSCHPADPTEWHPQPGKAGIRPDGFVASYVLAPCPTLCALAAVYADHPDYNTAWSV